jgi:hypothetical protein
VTPAKLLEEGFLTADVPETFGYDFSQFNFQTYFNIQLATTGMHTA